jgi:hypothetical protein
MTTLKKNRKNDQKTKYETRTLLHTTTKNSSQFLSTRTVWSVQIRPQTKICAPFPSQAQELALLSACAVWSAQTRREKKKFVRASPLKHIVYTQNLQRFFFRSSPLRLRSLICANQTGKKNLRALPLSSIRSQNLPLLHTNSRRLKACMHCYHLIVKARAAARSNWSKFLASKQTPKQNQYYTLQLWVPVSKLH